ncbi:hypothetical protein C173_03624 [Paenibacillus sp. FSL R7-277]|nr:hypothetical protein C173_03624 [Paenibacillus sp. FSL R7-277]
MLRTAFSAVQGRGTDSSLGGLQGGAAALKLAEVKYGTEVISTGGEVGEGKGGVKKTSRLPSWTNPALNTTFVPLRQQITGNPA